MSLTSAPATGLWHKYLVFYRCRQCKEPFERAIYRHVNHSKRDTLKAANVTTIHECRFGDLGVGDLAGIREVAVEPDYEGGSQG